MANDTGQPVSVLQGGHVMVVNPDGSINVVSGGSSGNTVDLVSVGGDPIELGEAAMAASLPVVIASDQTPIPVTGSVASAALPNVVASGNIGALNDAVTLELQGRLSAVAQVDTTGGYDATIAFQVSYDGAVTWHATKGVSAFDNVFSLTDSYADAFEFVLLAGATHVRLIATAYVSGDADVLLSASESAPTPSLWSEAVIGSSSIQPTRGVQIAFHDPNGGMRSPWTRFDDPTSGDQALVVRNIPSGTQDVSITGTVPLPTGAATEAKQDTGNTSLASIKTNTDSLVTPGGGGYVRQDSTATIAKESGGNLATVKTNTDPLVASGAGGYVRQDSTATIAKESGGNLASVKTNTDPLVAAAAGGYVRQDSNATIAMESGGNLATLAAKDFATQATLAAFYAALAVAQGAAAASLTGPVVQARVNEAALDYVSDTVEPLSMTIDGRLRVSTAADEIGSPWDLVSAFDSVVTTSKNFALNNEFTIDTVWE